MEFRTLEPMGDDEAPPGEVVFWRAIVPAYSHHEVIYKCWVAVRETPKGFWVVPLYDFETGETGRVRWTNADGGRYLERTKQGALQRLKARTRSWVKHARASLRRAEERAEYLGIDTKPRPRVVFSPDWEF